MIKKVKYTNLASRRTQIEALESQNFRMLHDDFDADWKSGDEPHGTMTFTDEPEETIPRPPVRDLAEEIDNLKVDIEAIKAKVGIV